MFFNEPPRPRWDGMVGEYSFTANWSLAIEYNHLFMGTCDINTSSAGLIPFAVPVIPGKRISLDYDMVTARLDYRFGRGAGLFVRLYPIGPTLASVVLHIPLPRMRFFGDSIFVGSASTDLPVPPVTGIEKRPALRRPFRLVVPGDGAHPSRLYFTYICRGCGFSATALCDDFALYAQATSNRLLA